MAHELSAAGCVVAINGAGRGIGRGLALAFARHGARGVVVSDLDAGAAVPMGRPQQPGDVVGLADHQRLDEAFGAPAS